MSRLGDTGPERDHFFLALIEDDPEELYDNAPCGYISALPDGTIVKANQTFLDWTDFKRDDLVGHKRFQDLLSLGDRVFYETHMAPLLWLQGRVREIAVDIVTSDGTTLPVLINSAVKLGDDGAPLLVRTAVFDARERMSYEQELLAARAAAEASEAVARALAATLQSSLLPPELPTVPGFDVAGAYRPAGDGTHVGGDFYDIFDTGRGTWGVMIGDVCGKGAKAAAVTSLARYSIRAASASTASPSEALRIAHEALLRQDPDQFCTALFMTLGTPLGGYLSLASAGHPLPLVRRSDGTVEELGKPGLLLGMFKDAQRSDAAAVLEPGEFVVLYTDGIVEARRGTALLGEHRLREAIGRLGNADADEIAQQLCELAVEFQAGIAQDDIAVVVVRRPPL